MNLQAKMTLRENSSHDPDELFWNNDPGPLFDDELAWTVTSLYLLISVVALFGNSLVVILIFKNKRMRTPFNLLLLNLSIADFMATLMLLPFVIVDYRNLELEGKIAGFVCTISVGLSLFLICGTVNMLTLCAMAITRYNAIVRRFKTHFQFTSKHVKWFAAVSWLAAILTVAPSASSFKYDTKRRLCYRDWPDYLESSAYVVITSCIGFIMPSVLMLVFYFLLTRHLWKQSTYRGGNIAALRARKKVRALLGSLILVYLVCWFPFYLIWLLSYGLKYYDQSARSQRDKFRFQRIAMIFPLLNCVFDPLIYAYRNIEFRHGFKQILLSCVCMREEKPRADTSDSKVQLKLTNLFVV